jgi:DNA-binding CsgD family transcriptional regulator
MGHVRQYETALAAGRANEKREIADLLRSRAHLLCGSDRALAQMYLEHGNSLRQIARLAQVTPGTVSRRIRRIVRRLVDETYALCLAGRDDFTGRELAMIRDSFVRGLPMTRISREHGVSYHRVRATIRKARRYAGSPRRPHAPVRGAGDHIILQAPVCTQVSEGTYDDQL